MIASENGNNQYSVRKRYYEKFRIIGNIKVM